MHICLCLTKIAMVPPPLIQIFLRITLLCAFHYSCTSPHQWEKLRLITFKIRLEMMVDTWLLSSVTLGLLKAIPVQPSYKTGKAGAFKPTKMQ